jgi:hypothetical protein
MYEDARTYKPQFSYQETVQVQLNILFQRWKLDVSERQQPGIKNLSL